MLSFCDIAESCTRGKSKDAARIGAVTAEHKRMLVARTAMGANRVIPTQIGEQLPRIC